MGICINQVQISTVYSFLFFSLLALYSYLHLIFAKLRNFGQYQEIESKIKDDETLKYRIQNHSNQIRLSLHCQNFVEWKVSFIYS